jgi:hypothetical protein
MSNIPNNIKKMWEEAAKIKSPMPKDAGKQIKDAHFKASADKHAAEVKKHRDAGTYES